MPKRWSAEAPKVFAGPIAPGASVSATFRVVSGEGTYNGDMTGNAAWTDSAGSKHAEKTAEKLRNVSPVKINEFRISDGTAANATNSFIELYNAGAGAGAIDISNWALTSASDPETCLFGRENSHGNETRGAGLLFAGSVKLRACGARIQRRCHHQRQKYRRHNGRRHHQHRCGNTQDRQHWQSGQRGKPPCGSR